VRLAGASLSFDWLEGIALLPCLAGLAVLLGGRPALTWCWPALAFLAFMIPLPYRLAHGLSGPLQTVAAEMSGYVLQTLGLPALVEGNTILLDKDTRPLDVAEACSGLSMLFVFLAMTTAAAILVRRPLLDRLLLLGSAIPIAILANVLRITATGVAHRYVGPRLGDLVFHDLAGWLMMPLAIGLLVLEVKLLDWLLVVAPAPGPAPVPGVRAVASSPFEVRPGRRIPNGVPARAARLSD
jgi:exosortase